MLPLLIAISLGEVGAALAAGYAIQERSLPARSRAPVALAPGPVSEEKVLIGRVVVDSVEARADPSLEAPIVATFEKTNPQGAPQVFLLLSHHPRDPAGAPGDWYEALLPVRPNGTTGYVPADALLVRSSPYRLVVDRHAYTLTLWDGPRPAEIFEVGIGQGATPTPVGLFYLVSLLEPPVEGSVYGKYAYGLSAYSEAISDEDWNGGAVIGLHGTNDPKSIGRASSNGCIRMRNRDIAKLAAVLPLGTPILIV